MSALEDVKVVSEPLTYRRDAPVSFFRDLIYRASDKSAMARLDAHAAEMRVELPKVEKRTLKADGLEYRVNPGRTQGQGGFSAPPLWLINEFAAAPRPRRVLADLIPTFNLPKGVSSVSLPRFTTGTKTGVAGDGGAVPSQDITDASVTSPAVPIAGQADIPLSMLEQSPPGAHIDHLIFTDLAGDYDAQLEGLLINGTGTNGQFLGLLNVPTGAGLATVVTYTDSSPTLAEMLPFIGQAVAKVGDNRNAPPEVLLMRTARWAWIASSDTNLTAGPLRVIIPAALDDAIPTSVGGAGQDTVIACRPSDMLLLESNATTRVMDEPLSGVLEVRVQLLGYVAALVGRYPTGIATVQGTGMTVQSGF